MSERVGNVYFFGKSGGVGRGVKVLPTASASNLGKILQYVGETSGTYVNGYFYKCILDGSTYKWVQIDTQPFTLGKFLSVWDCTTGKPQTEPASTPYTYTTGDYYVVGKVGTTNYKPNGTTYTGAASTTVDTSTIAVNDIYKYDGNNSWILVDLDDKKISWGSIGGRIANQSDLQEALDARQAVASKVTSISSSSTDAQYPSAKAVYDLLSQYAFKNKITTNPGPGDIAYIGPNGNVIFVELNTLDTSEIPSSWVVCGVVQASADSDGNVVICEKDNASFKQAAVFRFKVEGYTLDGESHTVTNINLHGVSCADFTYSASTKAAFATALDTYVRALTDYTYHAFYDEIDTNVYLILGNYTAYEGDVSAWSATGLTFTKWIFSELGANSTLKSKQPTKHSGSPRTSYVQVINLERFCEWLHDQTGSDYNPATFSYTSTFPVSFICWQTEVCSAPRALYGNGEMGWKAYIEDNYSCDFSASGTAVSNEVDATSGLNRRNGKAITQLLAQVTYKDRDGARQYLYPGIRYCYEKAYTCSQLTAGNWFMPSLYQGFQWESEVTYGMSGVTRATADAVNRGLYAIGGTAISCASLRWYCSRYFTNDCWCGYSYGYSLSTTYANSLIVRRFVLFNINS